ncbi:rod shape-determining protein MreD [Fusibacter paucivorans]|uniref:Rod shape-determining protein MreD n=1 Tax=Fusibacter paucivorans TaxID=76009 RepID=A0ABS5PP42_9FIRM|nr:rod shape-determining protein MreD [Fusibacter paucivorans]MBS7526833.1 rod shape-determining protein MreD [Fusibacter paucivorans]
MKKIIVFLLAIANFILMSTLFQQFRVYGVLANLCIVFSIIFAILFSEQHGYIFAVVSGLLQDTFLGKVLFVNTIIYTILVYVTVRVERIMFKGNDMTPIFLISMATIAYHLIFFVFMFLLQSTIPIHQLAMHIIIEVILNSIIGLIIYRLVFKNVFGYKLGDYNA